MRRMRNWIESDKTGGIDDYEMNKQMNQLLRLWKVKEGEKYKEG